MSAGSWIRHQCDRPIDEHERRWAFAAIAAVIVAVTSLLALTAPEGPSTHTAAAPGNHIRHQQASKALGERPAHMTSTGEHSAREFLRGYLSYLYGHDRASAIRDATASFIHSLPARAPRLSPAMRAKHARIVSLHPALAPAGLIGVTALVNDGSLVDYPVVLLLERQGELLLVGGLGGV